MNRIAKISILIFIFLAALIGFEMAASKIIATQFFNNKVHLSNDVIDFYKTHYTVLHHLRGLDDEQWKLNQNPRHALYNVIAPFEKNQNNILIQGDSWAGQFETPVSRKVLIDFAKNKGVGVINAGASSYAPSPMTIQLRKLRNQFNIHPSHIIAIID